MEHTLQVRMLGGFRLELAGHTLSDQTNRQKKVWLLLAYMIFNRQRLLLQENYLDLLQGAGVDESADPAGKLKALLYRARTMLNQLDENAGHQWIIRKNGTYAWNTEIPMVLDAEEFEQLVRRAAAADSEEERLDLYRQALALYGGDFLPRLNMEPWAMPIAAYYHRMYLDAAGAALTMLEARQLWPEAAELCAAALKVEPYSEELYQSLMRCRIAAGDRTGAVHAYEEMSELLFDTFGVMPSDESRALYREASRESVGTAAVPVSDVRENLREPFGSKGAMFCEYDFFRTYYQLQARTIVRSGDVIHIALFSIHGSDRQELPRRSLDRAMDNLQELLINNLRQGDVVTRCSVSQLIVMLPQANYENSTLVCQRLVKAFCRQYPHSPAQIHYSVQPLEPKTN